tara:strand:- start:664 stop:1131 length:468 start_codon:yes stop_codon:yes gene_type:complete
MTTLQLLNLNINLTPADITTLEELKTEHIIRYKLIVFFYKLKHNHDNYEKGKDVYPVRITWNINTTTESNVLNFSNGSSIQGVLAVKLYEYIFTEINKTNFISFIIEALRLHTLFNKRAYRYYRGKMLCDDLHISNYHQYHHHSNNDTTGDTTTT